MPLVAQARRTLVLQGLAPALVRGPPVRALRVPLALQALVQAVLVAQAPLVALVLQEVLVPRARLVRRANVVDNTAGALHRSESRLRSV